MEDLYCQNEEQWRGWLSEHHRRSSGIWLVFFKDERKSDSLGYEAAVEQALCFGWIDSLIRRIDGRRYARKFTPRKPGSRWAHSNKARAEKLIRAGLMTEAGLSLVKAAKEDGTWDAASRPALPAGEPQDFLQALRRNPRAAEHYQALAPGYRKQYALWISAARRPATRHKRIAEALALLETGQKLGMR